MEIKNVVGVIGVSFIVIGSIFFSYLRIKRLIQQKNVGDALFKTLPTSEKRFQIIGALFVLTGLGFFVACYYIQ